MSETDKKLEESNDEEIAVFTQDDCPACKELKEALKEYFENGDLKELNLSKDKNAQELADKLEVERIPTFISIKGDKVCKLDFDFKPVNCLKLGEVNLKKKEPLQNTTSL